MQGLHILIPFSSTSILELGQARTQELESTTKLSDKKGKVSNNVDAQQTNLSKIFYSVKIITIVDSVYVSFPKMSLCLNIPT